MKIIPLCFFLLSSPVFAQNEEVLDATRSQLNNLTNEADILLGGKRADDIRDQTTIRFRGQGTIFRNERPNHSYHFNVATNIATIKRWQNQMNKWFKKEENQLKDAILGKNHLSHKDPSPKDFSNHKEYNSKDQKNLKKQNPKDIHHREGDKQKIAATIIQTQKKNPWLFTLDKKINYHYRKDFRISNPKDFGIFAHARVRKDFETGAFFNSISQEAGWETENEWANLGDWAINYQLSSSVFTSLINSYNWQISHDNFTTAHSLSLRWMMNENALLSFDTGAGTSVELGHWLAESYFIQVNYSQGFLKQSLYFQLMPFIDFYRLNNFNDSLGLTVSLELRI